MLAQETLYLISGKSQHVHRNCGKQSFAPHRGGAKIAGVAIKRACVLLSEYSGAVDDKCPGNLVNVLCLFVCCGSSNFLCVVVDVFCAMRRDFAGRTL